MYAVNADITDTTLTGVPRRRVWVHPDVQSHSLVVLTNDQIHVTPLAGAPKADVVASVEAGFDPGELLGPLAVVVDLATVRDVKLDLLTNALVVEYAKNGPGTGRLTVVFTTPEAADGCFTKVWRRLGDGFQLRPYKREAWSAARAPLTLLVGVLVVTAALAMTISVLEDTASARAAADRLNAVAQGGAEEAKTLSKQPDGLLGWLGWRGVCALGGVAAAGAQVWMYRRITRPPERLELVRT
jgi:hypothetical protein